MAGVREAMATPIPSSLKRVCRACLECLPIGAFDAGHRYGKKLYRSICAKCTSAGTNTQAKAYNAVCKRLAKIEAASFLCARCKTQRPKILFRDGERTCLPCKVEVLEKSNAALLERVPRGDDWRRENATRRRHSDPAKCITRDARRLDLLLRQADGSLTAEVVGRLFAEAEGRPCPYCGICMDRRLKSLDHMIPITKGGLHSVTNAIICCLKCNSRKGARDFGDWLIKLKEPFATLSCAEYERRYGAIPAQGILPLEFTGGVPLAVN
jgi:5-methylcytosine-specific restriction endonuclease McrA